MTIWIRFIKDDDRVELAFNSRMTNVHLASDLEQIVDEMVGHMETQIENPALLNSRFRFDDVLFLDANFHWLRLTRGSSYLPLPDWLARKKAIMIADILGKNRLRNLGFDIPRGKVTAQEAVMLNKVKQELPSVSDVDKADDIELQEIAKSTENLFKFLRCHRQKERKRYPCENS